MPIVCSSNRTRSAKPGSIRFALLLLASLTLAACGKQPGAPAAADSPPPATSEASQAPAVNPNSSEGITSQAGTTTVPGQSPTPGELAAAAGVQPTAAPAAAITPLPTGEPVKVTPESIAAGKALFVSIGCNACHGGTGGGGMCPPLTNETWVYGGDDDTLRALITEGTLGMAGHGLKRVGVERVVGQMPPFGPILKDGDVDHLVAFIHSINKTAGKAMK